MESEREELSMNIGDFVKSIICPNMMGEIVHKFDGRTAIVLVQKQAIIADLKYWILNKKTEELK
jgi:hypothetical protein